MIINNHINERQITTRELQKLTFDFQQPCQIMLEDGSILYLDAVLRIIPGKRLVARAEWNNETVIAKLFFCKKQAEMHADREIRGAKNLHKMKIPSATLKSILVNQEKTTRILLFNYLHDADNLFTLWQEKHPRNIIYPVLQQVTQELATHHVLGVIQHDLHFKNFMVNTHKVYTLDGAELAVLKHKLDKEKSMRHFALFLAQMGAGFTEMQRELFLYYVKLRGWIVKKRDLADLFFYIREANRDRWRRFAKKIFRTSSQFTPIHGDGISGMADRMLVPKDCRHLLKTPQQFFESMPHKMLKAGGSATVIQVSVNGHEWVIKRYNVKHFFHRLKRLFTSSRAKKSWYYAQKLVLFNVSVPMPIAYLERKKHGLPRESYYISEYVSGTLLSQLNLEENQHATTLGEVLHLLKKLSFIETTHGDLKASNIVVNDQDAYLIDFDGTKEHSTLTSLRQHLMKDWRRFLANFQGKSAITKFIKESFL